MEDFISTLGSTEVFIACSVCIIFYVLWNMRRPPGVPPGPAHIPITGNSALDMSSPVLLSKQLSQLTSEYGPVFSVYFGKRFVVFLNDLNSIKEAFISNSGDCCGRINNPGQAFVNPEYPGIKGILTSDCSEEWKRQRNFALKILHSLTNTKGTSIQSIEYEANAIVQCLHDTNEEPCNPLKYIDACVINTMCSVVFGTRYEHDDEELMDLLRAFEQFQRGLSFQNSVNYVPFLGYTGLARTSNKRLKEGGDYLKEFYTQRLDAVRESIKSGTDVTNFAGIYLSQRVEDKDELQMPEHNTNKEDWCFQIVNDFFLAGCDTTATTLRWALLYMAKYPLIQKNVQAEIKAIFCDEKKDFKKLSDIKSLCPYTEATIAEIQRLACVLPFGVPHIITQDMCLGGYSIPEGTEIYANWRQVMHNPEIFTDPESLQPERFMGPNANLLKEKWLPYGLGQRSCMGENLASQQLFIFFTSILNSFSLEIPDTVDDIDDEPVQRTVISPKPYEICFVPR